ncbi:BAG domain-containing protein Samui [Orchesella cincta]|uniref:BAG domain-containing protein Samui n=1 Tax=Orchesella cincta TaxID=48709 RepID=A0A1D2NB00_ORCCI|nr:BAG domain-containing protein Samui [Orchesella cincta]
MLAGFPFEDLRSGARARFDEFANRHPMFSTMRNQPPWNMDDPFGHHGFPRERNNSGSSGAGSGASTASTGEERVIPIQIIRDDAPKPPARGKSPAPPQTEPIRVAREASPQPQTAGPQRCNTEPTHPIVLEDSRNTRAHSAPPSQNGNDKFVTKVSIDTNGSKPTTTQVGGNCSKSPKPESPANNGGRSIPIIIEGRQAPVFNANVNGNCPGQSSAKEAPQPKVSRPADRSPTPPPKKQTLPRDPLAQVNAVSEEVKELEKLVDMFQGTSREEREYMLLDEMLTRCLIKLDVVEAEGRDDVRTARKDCIRYIQSCISKLEKKHPLTEKPDEEQTMETAPAEDSQPSAETEKMETGSQQLSSNQNTPPLQLGSSSETANPKSAENSTPEPSNKGEGVQTMEVDSKETQPASASGDQQPVKA